MCKVSILINGEKFNMPVEPNDKCHMDMLGIPVQQIRYYEEPNPNGETKVKVEYPINIELGKMFFDLSPVLEGAVECCYDKLCPGIGPKDCTANQCIWEWTPTNPTADCTTTTCQYYWDVATKSWGFTNIGYNQCIAPCYCPPPPALPFNKDIASSSPVYSCAPSNEDCSSLTCRYFWDSVSKTWGFTNGAVNNCKSCTCPPPPINPNPDNISQYSQEYSCIGGSVGCGTCEYVSISNGVGGYEWSLLDNTCSGKCVCEKSTTTPTSAGLVSLNPCKVPGDTKSGSWKLIQSCPTCCICTQEKEPDPPSNPTIKQRKVFNCAYDCKCGTCSWIWKPYSCGVNCQYIWDSVNSTWKKDITIVVANVQNVLMLQLLLLVLRVIKAVFINLQMERGNN